MRVIVRKERPHPGAQLRRTDADGHWLTAFTTHTPPGGHAPHVLPDFRFPGTTSPLDLTTAVLICGDDFSSPQGSLCAS